MYVEPNEEIEAKIQAYFDKIVYEISHQELIVKKDIEKYDTELLELFKEKYDYLETNNCSREQLMANMYADRMSIMNIGEVIKMALALSEVKKTINSQENLESYLDSLGIKMSE